jgi:N-acetylneuraminic acid mutarotase
MKPLQIFLATPLLRIVVLILLVTLSCQKYSSPVAQTAELSGLSVKPGITASSPAILSWVQLANLPFTDGIAGNMPSGLSSPLGWEIRGKGYLCGGMTITSFGTAEELKYLWEYDTATKAWTQKTSFPGPTPDDGTDFVIGDKAYVIIDNETWEYKQSSNTWTTKASLPTDARVHATGFAIDGKGYVGLGFDLTTTADCLNDFWLYNPVTDKWHRKADFPDKREGAMSFVVDGNGYVCSGAEVTTGSTTVYLNDLWKYEPVADAWVKKAAFPAPGRMHGVGFGGTEHGYAGCGSDAIQFYNDFWEYTPAGDTWSSLPDVGGGGRDGTGYFRIGKNLYVAGGTGGIDGDIDFWTLRLSH